MLTCKSATVTPIRYIRCYSNSHGGYVTTVLEYGLVVLKYSAVRSDRYTQHVILGYGIMLQKKTCKITYNFVYCFLQKNRR